MIARGLPLLLLALAAGPARAQGPAPADSLADFLHGLADSTDAYFGPMSVGFDTTGIDSLIEARQNRPLVPGRKWRLAPRPLLRYHRAEGAVLGGGATLRTRALGALDVHGAYGFANQEGRYGVGLRRRLWSSRPSIAGDDASGPPPQVGFRGPTWLSLEARYERATMPLMPEHASGSRGTVGALLSGRNRQSVYERRGFEAALRLTAHDWLVAVGVRDAREQAMPRATTFTLLGKRDEVPLVTPADADDYTEAFGGVTWRRYDWDFAAGVQARGGGDDRWRLHGGVAKGQRVGEWIQVRGQIEAGAAAAAAPRQRRFEIGGPQALPSLGYGVGGGDHLLVGKLEVVEGHEPLRLLGLPGADMLAFRPLLFVHGGAVWDDERGVVFSSPPGNAWRGSAGVGLEMRPGFPDYDSRIRLQVAWPLGRDSGGTRVTFGFGTTFDLLGTP